MKKSRLLFLLGIALIIYAGFNIVMMILSQDTDSSSTYSSLINQEGFAPILAPEEEVSFSDPISESIIKANIPDRIIIPKINLDAPIKIARAVTTTLEDQEYIQYLVPEEYAAGYHENSAALGQIGNTVLSGHHNAYGEVFGKINELEVGDIINLYSNDTLHQYVVANKMILPEKDEPLDIRLENARWILPSDDERITLVTCWPQKSNTHRLIVVAIPLQTVQNGNQQQPCNDVELKQITDQFFQAYMKAEFLLRRTVQTGDEYRALIMDLSTLKGWVTSLDTNNCLAILKNNLLEYMDARMLQAGFNQVTNTGEEFQQILNLLESYSALLESYFESYNQRDRVDLIQMYETTQLFPPVDRPKTITAWNKEDQSLNIRENASANSRFLGGLPTGKNTIVIGKSVDNDWLLVPYKDTFGWINREFVRLNTPISVIPTILNQIIPQE